MTIKKISILNEFKCIAGDCPVSCCRGWKIPIDEKTYHKYLEKKGLLGIILRCSMVKGEEMVAFRENIWGCPFWGRNHLCHIQKKYGTDYMPRVCNQFPRQLYNLGFFCEETLYLACPEAARLFLMHADDALPFEFISTDGTPCYEQTTTNDDRAFLDYLLTARSDLINLLEKGCPYNSTSITDYALSAQNAVLQKRALPYPNEFWNKDVPSQIKTFTCTDMDNLMFNGFYQQILKTTSPFLYKLCRKYLKDIHSSDRKLNSLIKDLYGKIENLPNILRRYYEYFLLSDFLDIFEDYSFSRHISYGIAKTNMLLVFMAVYAKDKRTVSVDEISKIIAVFERRVPQIY